MPGQFFNSYFGLVFLIHFLWTDSNFWVFWYFSIHNCFFDYLKKYLHWCQCAFPHQFFWSIFSTIFVHKIFIWITFCTDESPYRLERIVWIVIWIFIQISTFFTAIEVSPCNTVNWSVNWFYKIVNCPLMAASSYRMKSILNSLVYV